MATITTSAGHGGKKPLDQEIPLIPFIDLLFCCVMFLLATAVWNQLGGVESPLSGRGAPSDEQVVAEPPLVMTLRVSEQGFSVAGTDGTSFEVPRSGGAYDYAALNTRLSSLRAIIPATSLVIAPDDGIGYERVMTTLDTAIGAGFSNVSVAPTS